MNLCYCSRTWSPNASTVETASSSMFLGRKTVCLISSSWTLEKPFPSMVAKSFPSMIEKSFPSTSFCPSFSGEYCPSPHSRNRSNHSCPNNQRSLKSRRNCHCCLSNPRKSPNGCNTKKWASWPTSSNYVLCNSFRRRLGPATLSISIFFSPDSLSKYFLQCPNITTSSNTFTFL